MSRERRSRTLFRSPVKLVVAEGRSNVGVPARATALVSGTDGHRCAAAPGLAGASLRLAGSTTIPVADAAQPGKLAAADEIGAAYDQAQQGRLMSRSMARQRGAGSAHQGIRECQT